MARLEPRYLKSDIPAGSSGDWCVEKFEVVGERTERPGSPPPPDCALRRPGTYTRLRQGATVFMTDLYDEWWTQRIAIEQALHWGGRVLVAGLGLGLIVDSMLEAASPVERITVLELSPDVLRLSGPHLKARHGDRLELVQANAFDWEPPAGRPFSVVWHDIWPNPRAPEVESDMKRLETRYQGACRWHGCWPREYLWVYDRVPWDRARPEPAT